MALIDSFGRVHDDLRLSITDRCNLRCTYCMPEDPVWFQRAALLTYEEMARVVRIGAGEGVRKVRVTGGEPLVRRDVTTLLAALAAIEGVGDLSLTTNGVLLKPMARDLAGAGLGRLNVSLDTLDRGRFEAITGRDRLRDVLAGLEAARDAGLAPIKINAVLLRGRNEDDAIPLAAFGRDEGYEVRFIECMPLANGQGWDPGSVVTGSSLRAAIGAKWPIARDPKEDPHAPASRFLYEDGMGAVGFIDSVSAPFCGDCSRLRVTSDGKLRVCLYDDCETDLRAPLRAGAADAAIAALMHEALRAKGRGGALDILASQRALPLARTMHQIGG
ncbi:MAG TPA: GTP 3',8-cyclase MoaA [Candidatus Polarisedimenticolaceae bacterium]|nr:GTP 3',8-cyclase MoaA [Candidatus Polarisedimenticolaceae bacterium]